MKYKALKDIGDWKKGDLINKDDLDAQIKDMWEERIHTEQLLAGILAKKHPMDDELASICISFGILRLMHGGFIEEVKWDKNGRYTEMPKEGIHYWFISSSGQPHHKGIKSTPDKVDIFRFKSGNMYRNKESTKKALHKIMK